MRSLPRGLLASALLAASATAGISCGAIRTVAWTEVLDQPAAFYASARARAIADAVVAYQRPSGGWPKDVDMTRPPAERLPPARPDATIDNGATVTQIRYLAHTAAAAADRRQTYRAALLHGIDYLLAAQYANGGWPQFYPLRNDYSRHITFNDNAMINVMTLLDDVSAGTAPFDQIDDGRRRRARDAVGRGIDVILAAQVVVDGSPTVWCAQHDEVTLQPRPARSYEHASLSGSESVAIVRFLMRSVPRPEIVTAIEAAVTWLTRVRLPDGRWARFYQIGTNRPIFSGRDGVVRYTIDEIEQERREGYAWFGNWPHSLLEREYPQWRAGRARR
jgi:PelA/Pel-15E family pectate lyase